MAEDRVILHSDANAFYASVECALDPSLRGKAVALYGSAENRHGIVLAKSELAKSAGVRTGFTALVTGLCFVVAMFLSPIAQLIPSAATSAALIYVGVLMMSSVKDIEWGDPAVALPAFLTITIMAFGFSISFGIGVGLISCVLVKICTGKIKEISPVNDHGIIRGDVRAYELKSA